MTGSGELVEGAAVARGRLPGMLAHEWTATLRATFLDAVTESGRVDVAARTVGVSLAGAYAHRRRNATFAADWQQALAARYDQLEAVVLDEIMRGAGSATFALSAALVLLEQRPAAEVPAASVAKAPNDTRPRSEAELLRRLKAYAKRTGTPEPQ